MIFTKIIRGFIRAIHHWYKYNGFYQHSTQDYLMKSKDINPSNWYQDNVRINFSEEKKYEPEEIKSKFYFRTAYRNEPDFNVYQLNQQPDPTTNYKFETLMQNDQVVSENYQRLVANTLTGIYDESNDNKTVEELRSELIGKIKKSLSNIFDELNLSSIGNPLINGSFYFTKGIAKDFHYKNLSAGEKSVFDLILDMIIKSEFYSDAVYCIDEPEAHMHTRLQSKVLREIYNITPPNSQLWISTHSVGMLKEAEDIENEYPGTVVFLDFHNKNFDFSEVIEPTKISKAIWDKFFDLAFADFSKLISPKQIVFCEGTSKGREYKDFDAQIYNKILGQKYHETTFISIGSCSELVDIENEPMKIVSSILKSSNIIKFIDRDDKSNQEVKELLDKGIKTSSKRHIECYVFDDEIIRKLCISQSKPDCIDRCLEAKKEAMEASKNRGNAPDDIKSASGDIFVKIKKILSLTQCGNSKCAFIRDTIVPLITEDTDIYKQIEKDIFG
ncbi:AAA family ATPase [Providencia zhijiangensis]|uniref:AAA family ATPase n=1 Tax=Providencia zhijiangensis TaxID=3053982 RepID=A0ABZ0N2A4_9GAMM|nr:AAA family ATPase [Providencia sp. D4759]WPA92449.1 AAA family ATPase [Providencia sp. D4759]